MFWPDNKRYRTLGWFVKDMVAVSIANTCWLKVRYLLQNLDTLT